MKNLIWILTITFLLFYLAYDSVAPNNSTRQISGQVTYVVDGDTFQLSTQNIGDIRIRIAEIDAPELQQPYGKKAKSKKQGLWSDQAVTAPWIYRHQQNNK